MSITTSQAILLDTNKFAMLVLLICYIPHFAIFPWWLFLLISSTIAYRLLADYYAYQRLPKSIRLMVVIFCLFILKLEYGSFASSGFFIGFFLVFVGLKVIEIHHLRDIKVLIFCHFYLIFTALIMIQDVWILIYMIIGVLANFSLMIRLYAPAASLSQISGKSLKPILLAIPLSLMLFYLFPRLNNPLWQISALTKNETGFSETMNPGSITDLFNDDSTALNVTFKNKPITNGYWQGLHLSVYDGFSWRASAYYDADFLSLASIHANADSDYEVIVEPDQLKWLFYLNYPVASNPDLIFSSAYGLMKHDKENVNQRFAYRLKAQSAAPYQPLNNDEIKQNTQLPNHLNPRLYRWANENYALVQQNPKTFIQFLQNQIKQQSFWYTLSPPSLQGMQNQMDYFWFETRQGFCEHYASAITFILRSVGIPARVILGYHGGEWNPIGHYLTIKKSDAHAWVEYWQDGQGWQSFDPTKYIALEHRDQVIRDRESKQFENLDNVDSYLGISWFQRSKLLLSSMRFFAERWVLFYNHDAQHDLLNKLGMDNWSISQLLQTTIACFILFLVLFMVYYQWQQKRSADSLLIEYRLLQKEFRRFNVATPVSATLKQQCTALMSNAPKLTSMLLIFLYRYEKLRLKQQDIDAKTKHKTILLLRALRKKLRRSVLRNRK